MQYVDIQPALFNNGIKRTGMGMWICQDFTTDTLVAKGGGGKIPAKKYTRKKKYTREGNITTRNVMPRRNMKRTMIFVFPGGYQR